MVATQVLRRRGTEAQNQAMIPAEGEITVDLTNDTLRVGDGSRSGGWILPNFNHIQTQSMNFAVAAGTANALTATINPAPLGLVQGLRVSLRVSANNTGAATLDLNSLGVISIQKIEGSSFVNLVTGDLINGAIYDLVYTGTIFLLLTRYDAGLVSIGQGDLRTSSGTASIIAPAPSGGITSTVTLPGGQYGFYPQISRNSVFSGAASTTLSEGAITFYNVTPTTRFGCVIMKVANQPASQVIATQRFITSSPPYDLGNGDVGGFIFLHLNSNDEIISTYAADTPPWAYNGPTDIRATHKCPITDKKYRTTTKKLSVQEILDGVPLKTVQEEITHEIKNADMSLIPHPFETKDDHKVLMLDPMDDRTERLITLLNNGNSQEVNEILTGGYLELNSSNIKRGCHKSVRACKFKFKGQRK